MGIQESHKEKVFSGAKIHSLHEKQKLLSTAELSIWLDSYDDIFSDFDSRAYGERTLSDDFIFEAKKMAKEKLSGKIELKLLMPSHKREIVTEEIIIKSLHSQFRRLAHNINDEMKKMRRKGFLLSFVGMVIMICALFIAQLQEQNFMLNASRVILEPAGWFFVWTGFDNIFYLSRSRKPEYNFNNRMAHAEIIFLSF